MEKIKEAYIEKCKRWNEFPVDFPIPTTPDNNGGYHFVLEKDGEMQLIVTERGQISEKQSTYSLDEFLYWVFRSKAKARALNYEVKNRVANQDFRRLYFAKAVEYLAKISQDWALRLQSELDVVLKEHPFIDDD